MMVLVNEEGSHIKKSFVYVADYSISPNSKQKEFSQLLVFIMEPIFMVIFDTYKQTMVRYHYENEEYSLFTK